MGVDESAAPVGGGSPIRVQGRLRGRAGLRRRRTEPPRGSAASARSRQGMSNPEHRSATARLVIDTLDLRSTVRMTVAVTLALWAIVFVGLIALYLLGLVSGGLGGVEGFIASIGFSGFRFTIIPFIVAFIVV